MAIGTATAMIGSAVVGGVVASNSASSAAKSQKDATRAATASTAADLAFQREQYDDWQRVYGPIQDNLSSFYQGLSGDALAASGLKEFEKQYTVQQQEIQRSFAQRGVDSPAQSMMMQQSTLGAAETRANIRQQAPLQAATAQQGFLNQQVNNPATQGISSALQNQSAMYGNQSTMYGNQAQQAYNVMGANIQQGFNAYGQYQQNQLLQQQTYANNLASSAGSYYSAGTPLVNSTPAGSGGWEMY